MHSIGAIAAGGTAGLGTITAQLPWAWFALMAVVDVALVCVVVGRRRAARAGVSSRPLLSATDALVLRSGWRVPRSRALRVRARPATYAWPLHSEYMVSRLV
ncbi:MAG: hypothetical protein M3Z57_00175 [Candidatus Dormibacteraeota bacterium]|nr:hypothetical protein [Candidatus Dormibacteraeota bacterium]